MSKGVLTLVAVFVGAALVIFGLNWLFTGVNVVSPQNVKAQQELVIGHYNDMIAAANNVCTVQKAGPSKTDADKSPVLVESPTLAYEATFRNIRADYNSAVDNLFKAKIVMPAGYPSSDQLNQLDTTDWCTVPTQLLDLRR